MSNLDLPVKFDSPDNNAVGLDAGLLVVRDALGSVTSVSLSSIPLLVVRDALGNQVIAAQSGQTVNFAAEQGQHYRLLSNAGEGEEQLLDNVISVRQGEDLIMTYAQGAQVTINGYFDLCVPVTAELTDNLQCSATVAGDTEAGYVIRGTADSAGAGANSPQIVYTHGAEQELLALVNGNVTDELLLTTYLASIVEPAAAAAFSLPVIVGGAGAAAALALGGGGSSSSSVEPGTTNYSGSIKPITGILTDGKTLTAGDLSDLDSEGVPDKVTYQWKADGQIINNATKKTYTLTVAEVGKAITVVATYTDDKGNKETVTSIKTTIVLSQTEVALKLIQDSAEDNTTDQFKVTLSVLELAGIGGVNVDNLASIISALNSLSVDRKAVDTLDKLQTLVNSYVKILLDGEEKDLALSDFTHVGVEIDLGGLDQVKTEIITDFLIDVVSQKERKDLDSVPELQELADAVKKLMTVFGSKGDAEGDLSVDQLTLLGVDDVTAENLVSIQAQIVKADFNADVKDKLNNQTDMTILKHMNNLVAGYIEKYDAALKGIAFLAVGEKNVVDGNTVTNVQAATASSNLSTYLSDLGVVYVNELAALTAIRNNMSREFKQEEVDTIAEIQAIVDVIMNPSLESSDLRGGSDTAKLFTPFGEHFDFSHVAKTADELSTFEAADPRNEQTKTSASYDVYLADNKTADLWHNPEITLVI